MDIRNFFKDRFGFGWDEATYELIEDYFKVTRQEDIYFECKEYNNWSAQLIDLQTEIVALKNSQGGIIIYGGPRSINHTENLETTLRPIKEVLDERNLLQSLIGRIEPYCSAIETRLLKNGVSDASLLLILVDKTLSTAFMVKERGFYYRVDRHSKPAPHHYVEALMKQVSLAEIVVERITATKSLTSTHLQPRIKLEIRFRNESRFILEKDFTHNMWIVDYNLDNRASASMYVIGIRSFFLLYGGHQYDATEEVIVNRYNTDPVSGHINIGLTFKGTNSAPKYCAYRLELDRFPGLDCKIIKTYENKYLWDK